MQKKNIHKTHKNLTHTKSKKPQTYLPNTQENPDTDNDSMTMVYLVGSPRKTASFKCNEKLWKTFVSWCKARGWSVCHFMEAIIKVVMGLEVYLSRTIKPLNIENLYVQRVVKRVRRYAVEVEGRDFVRCEARGCREPAEFRFYHENGKVYNLCGKHVEEYREFAVKVEPLTEEFKEKLAERGVGFDG